MNRNKKIKSGKVEEVKPNAEGKPNSFIIKSDDGNFYFAHLGDIKTNEEILYESNYESLEKNQRVEFIAIDLVEQEKNKSKYIINRAISIKKK